MFRIFSISLLFAVFQAATSEVPENCRGPPPGVPRPGDCCKIPPVFTEEDFKECGIEKSEYKARGPPVCSKHICILKRHGLVKDDDIVDKEAVGAFLDKWSSKNPEFKDAMDKAKEKCLTETPPGPPQICEPNRIGFCIMVTTFHECPTWENSDNCKKVQEHIDECKAYFSF